MVFGSRQSPAGRRDEVPLFVLLERQKTVPGHLGASVIQLRERRADVDVVERVAAADVQSAVEHKKHTVSAGDSRIC